MGTFHACVGRSRQSTVIWTLGLLSAVIAILAVALMSGRV